MTKNGHLDSSDMVSRKRLPMGDELKAQLAIERFNGGLVEIRELAKRYRRAPTVISRAISSAFEERLVEVRKVPRRSRRLPELELALRRRFDRLRSALVVEVPGTEADVLHEHLGHAIADYTADAAFRDGERVLLGSGRCIFHMSDRLAKLDPKLRPTGIRIISVCGDSYPYHEIKRNICLDANANVNLLAQAFENATQIGLTSRHIFGAGGDGWRHDYYKRFWEPAPTLGILGVGVLDQQHQLDLLTAPGAEYFPLMPLSGDTRERIRHLIDLSRALSEVYFGGYGPIIAEIGMYLFPIVDLEAVRSGEMAKKVATIEKYLAELNNEIFAPSLSHLQQIQSIILVGGSSAKAPAIRWLLVQGSASDTSHTVGTSVYGLPIHVLCTDKYCAEQLLKLT